jgi:hypothetical protein
MRYRILTIGQTIQYPSKEILGCLTDVFELVISGPFTPSLQLFRSDSEYVVAVTVPE